MKTILVTGANGQIGRELQHLAIEFEQQIEMIAADRSVLDITDAEAVRNYFETHDIDICVNCAAYTAVDKAEKESELAHLVNQTAVKNLASICAEKGANFIHFSTDYVYHNQQNTPFKEDDPTQPQSVYAHSKLKGEEEALLAHPKTMIIRTSWVYSFFGHNFVKTMQRLGKDRDLLNVVFDQVGTPTYAYDIARTVLHIIRNDDLQAGIFNYSNEGVCSWYDFAIAIFELSEIDCNVLPIESKDYPTPAKRPPFSVLNKEKIKHTFGIDIPHWRSSLKHCLARLEAE